MDIVGLAYRDGSWHRNDQALRPELRRWRRPTGPHELTADQLETCRDGSLRYTRVTYRFPSSNPFPANSPGALDPQYRYPCPLPAPRLENLRVSLRGRGSYPNYSVRVAARLKICAPKQRLEVEVSEEERADDGSVVADHARSFVVHHKGGCATKSFGWRLRDEFFGIGTYVVRANVLDSIGQTSRAATRRVVTSD